MPMSQTSALAPTRRPGALLHHPAEHAGPIPTTVIVSWNLLRTVGASVEDVARLVAAEKPDLLLMQEATIAIDGLAERIGGFYARSPLPGRIHGVACWSPTPFRSEPRVHALQPGSMFRRVCQVIEMDGFSVANVHLSHGQMLNRRQLRLISTFLPPNGAVLGDFNLLGPAMLPGFKDVGPRAPTHRMVDMVPIRLDRCLARGLDCVESRVLPHQPSDHHPIRVRLRLHQRSAHR
ncbi:endonuclease/exonuclease/phosphatase family protein [Acetobacteraceae bacterium KSS8]|uniref:Endonuclease/exonuclease/phosphatase family protein n=1 Tax=Endosaccharibacter trunci TaxID=2812733 RepID=A0ABT1W298_9PROT|nr:endonuclease/exonuclease/phosphatase family protein [Acetobacteraceae bacterium KSS8]